MTTLASGLQLADERSCDGRTSSRRRPAAPGETGAVLPSLLCWVPIVVGAGVMLAGGAGVSRWGGHLVCGVVGATLAATRWPCERTVTVACTAALVAIALTLVAPDLDGVRRWLVLGPLRVHASALLAPSLIVVAALEAAHGRVRGPALLAALQVVHLQQPDAGQATAIASAALAVVLSVRRRARPAQGAAMTGLGVACVALGFASWLRRDPLLPVAYVEDVVARAAALSPAAGVLCVLALSCMVIAPLSVAFRCRREASIVTAGVALSAGFAGAIAASARGAFPVPLLGFSPAAVLGAFAGVGVLLAGSRSKASARAIPARASEVCGCAGVNRRHRADARDVR